MPQRLPAPNTGRRPLRDIGSRSAVVASTLATAAALTVLPTAATAVPVVATAAPATASAAPPVQQRGLVPAAHVATAPAAEHPAAARSAARGAVGSSALQNALGKIGSPYRWGASGPRAFDCSGLVNWAYKQEGVKLPRSSRALASAGTEVDRSELRPGDLVLFYKPVSHVGIYVGHGQVVHASTSGSPVKISDMDRMPFNSARRV